MWWLTACAPLLEDDTPYVTAPRVLAASAEPAEALPDELTQLTALYADASGPLDDAPLEWAFCLAPKPLAELGPVSPNCLQPGSEDLSPIGSGLSVEAQLPLDACSLFGPNPPPPQDGELPGRPADPDGTGGFYQPVVAFLEDGAPTLAAIRVRCGLANVSQETYIAWNQGYLSNVNPEILELTLGGQPVAGQPVALQVRWPHCEEGEAPCDGAEEYVVYDPVTQELLPRREALSATWFASGGELAFARNGRPSDDMSTNITNEWTPEAGDGWVAVVLRDERGGSSFATLAVSVSR